jgi:hypothetical protein
MANDIPDGPVHHSRLKKFRLSPAHYLADNEVRTPSTGKGSAVHSVMLGGKRVVVYEGGARNAKFSKWQDFQAANEGAHIVIPSEAGEVTGMRQSLEAHPEAMRLLDGVRENLIEWEFAGRKCAGTPDVVHLTLPGCRGKVVVELKTSKTAAPWSFPWECKRYGYYTAGSWYANGAETTLAYPAGDVSDFFIVTVESTRPWPVTIFRVEDRALTRARMEWRGWMDQLLECERSGKFPAYTDQVVSIGLDDDLDLDFGANDDEVAA